MQIDTTNTDYWSLHGGRLVGGRAGSSQMVGQVVPEPSTALLLTSGLIGLAIRGRRRGSGWYESAANVMQRAAAGTGVTLALLVAFVLASMTGVARASAIFTDRTAWEMAAPGPISVEDFESAPLGTLPVGDATTDLGLVDVTLFGTVNGTGAIVDGGAVNGSREFEGLIQNNPGFNQVFSIRFTFPEPVLAWGADFMSTATGDLLVVTANGSTYFFDDELGFPGNGFVGSIEDVEFDYITFTTESLTTFGELFQMDDLSFAVPEPSTGLLLGAGVIGLTLSGRRRGRRRLETASKGMKRTTVRVVRW